MGQCTAQTRATGFAPLWGRSVAWLLFLGPFFFLSYGLTNQLAAERGVIRTLVFAWERQIPFVPWTIMPYWSIDVFYGLSFLLCQNKKEVDKHALRLFTAQLISITCFLVYPLHFSFERPPTDGVFGAMFDLLLGFDQPYNQAPSLHISLLVILWSRFASTLLIPSRLFVHGWGALIGMSVLTTYQHHFIDIPTGALVGFFCLWALPERGNSPLLKGVSSSTPRHRQLAMHYLICAAVMAAIATTVGGLALWLWWLVTSFVLVSLVYSWSGAAAGFQKVDGKHSVAAAILFAPYFLGAWLNSRWWTRHSKAPTAVLDGVWLGRLPTSTEMARGKFSALCDVTAELSAPCGSWCYVGLSWLDLVPPSASQLAEAARQIEILRANGSVLVCCALGYSRSACAVLGWMLITGRARDANEAETILRKCHPRLVLSDRHRAVLAVLVGLNNVRTSP